MRGVLPRAEHAPCTTCAAVARERSRARPARQKAQSLPGSAAHSSRGSLAGSRLPSGRREDSPCRVGAPERPALWVPLRRSGACPRSLTLLPLYNAQVQRPATRTGPHQVVPWHHQRCSRRRHLRRRLRRRRLGDEQTPKSNPGDRLKSTGGAVHGRRRGWVAAGGGAGWLHWGAGAGRGLLRFHTTCHKPCRDTQVVYVTRRFM